MKRLFILFAFLSILTSIDAQIYTFNVRERDKGGIYNLSINTSSKIVSAEKGSQTLFTYFYTKMAVSPKGSIGFSFKEGTEPSFKPTSEERFILIKSGSIGCSDPVNTIFYTFDPIDTSSFTSTFNSLKSSISGISNTNIESTYNTETPSSPTDTSSESNRTFTVNGVSFTMIYVKGGSFTMGASSNDSDADDAEKPAHRVTLSNYYIGQAEVTQGLWQAIMGSNPSYFKGDIRCPVENVSWDDCQEFIRKLNNLTGQRFRLPTEAEWEFAARGGTKSNGYKYSGSNNLGNVAWYDDNSNDKTHPVASKSSNKLGIYDMSGNVWEWCQDWYDGVYYRSSPSTDPKGPSSGSCRVLRGGSWYDNSGDCRVSYRDGSGPDYGNSFHGFRLAL